MASKFVADKAGEIFHIESRHITELSLTEALTGVVWIKRKPVIWSGQATDVEFVRSNAAQKAGLNSILCLPLMHGGDVVGLLKIGSIMHASELERYKSILSTIETYVGTELARKRLENDLTQLFETLPNLICLVDFSGVFLKMNQAGSDLLGYDEHEIIGKSIDRFVHPDDLDFIINEIPKLSQVESVYKFEIRFVRKSGEIIWLSWHCKSMVDERVVYATAKNITQEKKLTELLDDAAKMARIGGWEIDAISNSVYWSKMVHQLHETDPETFEPSLSTAIEFYRKDYRELVSSSISQSISSGIPFDFEAPIVTSTGSELWVRALGSAEFLDGKCIRIFGSFQDIHERKVTELRLKSITDLYDETSTLAKIGSWELDLLAHNDTDRMYWSPIVKEILEVDLNYNPSLTSGFEFYEDESKSRIQEAVDKLIKTGLEIDEELLIKTQSGNDKWIRCIGKSEQVDGICTKIYGSFQDIHSMKSISLQLEETLGSISDAFYAVDKNWNITYFNKEAELLLKRTREDVYGKNLWIEFAPAKGTELEIIYKRVAQSEVPETFEYYYPGDNLWYEINTYPSKGGISSYFKNITERKRIAQELQNAYDEKDKILESIGDGFFAMDKDWKVTYWNNKAEEIIGVKRDELLGFNLWEKFPIAKELEFFQQYKRSFEEQKPVSFREYFQPFDQWYEANGYPTKDGISVFFKDITKQMKAEKIVHEANERFQKVTYATTDAIWDWDIENNSYYRGEGFEKLFGNEVAKHIATDQFWKDGFHPDDIDGLKESINTSLSDPNCEYWQYEYRIVNTAGNIKTVIDKGVIIRDKSGLATRMVGAITDITDRIRHEQELKALNELLTEKIEELEISNDQLEQFAFIASHDLQEPLRMISSFLNQLERKYGNNMDEKAKQYIYFATDGAKRMKQIILDLLEFSRAGKFQNLPLEQVDIADIMDEYQILRRRLINDKKVTIQFNQLPVVSGFKAPLVQTLHSLLDNAIKYSKSSIEPYIEILTFDLGKEWQISVKDNGIGIDPSFHDKIFIIFQRLHEREKYSGTGIGLSIAKKHVESWGGKIWVESKPEIGSTFHFTIRK